MKLKARPDSTSLVQRHSWAEVGHWFAELRDDSHTDPPGNGYAEADSADGFWSEAFAQSDALAEARAQAQAQAQAAAQARTQAQAQAAAQARTQAQAQAAAQARTQAQAQAAAQARTQAQAQAAAQARTQAQAQAAAQARTQAQAQAAAQARTQAQAQAAAQARTQVGAGGETETAARTGAAARAVIGDQLRMPIMWCEMGSCISWYADPAALGEADTRARAVRAGWQIDALDRLACPRCQQSDPGFWAPRPVVQHDRDTAIGRADPEPGDRTVGSAATETSRDVGLAASREPVGLSRLPGWHVKTA